MVIVIEYDVAARSYWIDIIPARLKSSLEMKVSWDDCKCALGQNGERAMEVAKLLLDLITAKQEFKQLPKPKCSYL